MHDGLTENSLSYNVNSAESELQKQRTTLFFSPDISAGESNFQQVIYFGQSKIQLLEDDQSLLGQAGKTVQRN